MVFAAIRPGGTAGRTADERVALDLGLLGQETTGAGGISYALRSIPRMLELAAQMRRHCPDAWLLNFTNPAGMVTEALVPVLGRKVVGICDSASGLVYRAARAAGVALPEGRLDGVGYYGLNHLGWLYRLESGGRDVLPGLLADADALAGFEEGRLFPQPFLAGLGCLPNEYLYYYYETERALAGIRSSPTTRGESIDRQQSELYPRLAAAGAAGLSAVGRGTPLPRGGLPRGGPPRRRAPGRGGPGRGRLRARRPRGHARPLRRRPGGADPEHPQHRRHAPTAAPASRPSRDCRRTPSSRFPAG